ncbi:MAG TPA: carboxypeptidase regulatory-like domain-containing protein [Acidobacteriaceae bacterium]|nr:carboxypeptidase regulatory-like domain-containing protein [Acidobacteriaceae bacterium]
MKRNYLIVVIALAFAIVGATSSSPPAKSGTNTAGVKGTVKLEGAVPTPARINMGSDPICARQHRTAALAEEVLADKSGDLQNVVVFVSEGLGDRTFDVPAQPAVLEQKGCTYQPHVLAFRANQKLQILNGDACMHNIHPSPANNREWNKAQTPGSTVEETFAREEVGIPIKCNVHPWMRGYLAVFKHPFFAVTGKDGSFDLSNLPPGNYTISAWHEKLGTATQKITVGSNETKTLQFVFKSRS